MKSNKNYEIFIRNEHQNELPQYEAIVEEFYQRIKDSIEINNKPLVFVFGGDGTLLTAVEHYNYEGTYLLIKAHGTLGHYAECKNVEDLVNFDFSKLDISYEDHYLLEMKNGDKTYTALNEVLLSNPYATLKFTVYVDDQELSLYAASGILISTPFGSTAYNHSLGGSIIYDNGGYGFNILAPIENHVYHSGIKSVYLQDHHELKIVFTNDSEITLANDMKTYELDKNDKTILINKSKKHFTLLHLTKFSPCTRLNRSFVWNLTK